MPTFLEADGPLLPLGSICSVGGPADGRAGPAGLAEVIGANDNGITLAPLTATSLLRCGALVEAVPSLSERPIGLRCLAAASIRSHARSTDAGPSARHIANPHA